MKKLHKSQKKCSHFIAQRSLFSFTNKRNAQALSLSTVVIAALVLLVLVVLSLVFASKMGGWNKSFNSCDTICVKTTGECEDKGYIIPVPMDNCKDSSNEIEGSSFCCRSEK